MQRTEIIDKKRFYDLMDFILSNTKTELYESYSVPGQELVRVKNYFDFMHYFEKSISEKQRHFGFAIYHPENKGKLSITKINLDPQYSKGQTYRYRIDGWGLIFVHLNIINVENEIECRISVNSKKRAENWKSTNPELGEPELWEWKILESNARKIIRHLKKLHTTM